MASCRGTADTLPRSRQPDFVTTLVLRRQLRDGLNGTHKYIIIINGTSPGPLLRVREGDLVSSA